MSASTSPLLGFCGCGLTSASGARSLSTLEWKRTWVTHASAR